MKVHDWTEADDVAALYLYKYGGQQRGPTVEDVAHSRGMSESSLRMRMANFKAIEGGAGLRNWAQQSESVHRRYSNLSEPELRALAFGK